jgi:hypothetical protein
LTEKVTDTSRDQDPDGADEPTTGPPAGAAEWPDQAGRPGSAGDPGAARRPDPAGQQDPARQQDPAGQSGAAGGSSATGDPGATRRSGATGDPGATRRSGATGRLGASAVDPAAADPEGEAEQRQRRRRRFFLIAIAVGAAIVVIALCAGALGIISAIDGVRDRTSDAREHRELRDAACLELEQRLNRLTPPGATGGPQSRSVAVQSENAAVRIYVNEIHSQRDQDGWRQLLDARTAYAEALVQQAKSRTPAFYVAPKAGDGRAVTDELARWSPAPCAGPIRRLAAPDL